MLPIILSITFNLLVIIAFIFDRIYRINSIKEYKEAKDAQIQTLKDKVDFVEKYNNSFLAEKFKNEVSELESLVQKKEEQLAVIKTNTLEMDRLEKLLSNQNIEIVNKDSILNEIERLMNEYKDLKALNEKHKKDFEFATKAIVRIMDLIKDNITLINPDSFLKLSNDITVMTKEYWGEEKK